MSLTTQTLSAQARLFKSLKLWSFYVDLQESIGTVDSTRRAYDRMFELKIANAQIVINYANFLEDNDYFEDSFRVYERGVDLFTYPIAFELWNTYLIKFTKRYGGEKLERARDLFEQALEKCPPKYAKPIYLLYGQFEARPTLRISLTCAGGLRPDQARDGGVRPHDARGRDGRSVRGLRDPGRQDDRQLRSAGDASRLRARDRGPAERSDGRDVSSLCSARAQARRDRPGPRHLRPCQSVLRPQGAPAVRRPD